MPPRTGQFHSGALRSRIRRGRKVRPRVRNNYDRAMLTGSSIDEVSSSASYVRMMPRSSRLEKNLATRAKAFGIKPWVQGEIAPQSFLVYYSPRDAPWDYLLTSQIEERDPLAAGMIGRVINAVLSIPRRIVAANETPGAIEARDMVTEQLKNLKGRLSGYSAIASKITNGSGFCEINWTDRGGEIRADKLVYRPMHRFGFVEDDKTSEPLLCVRRSRGLEIVPPGKFMYGVYGRTDNPWGKGIKDDVYWYWLARLYLILDLLLFCERRAKPVVDLSYPSAKDTETQSAKDINDEREDDLLDVGLNIHGDGVFVHTNDVEGKFMGGGQGMDMQSANIAIEVLTRGIATAFLHESQTSMPKSMGSYAAYNVLEGISLRGMGINGGNLADDITEQLVYPMVDLNLPGAPYPFVTADYRSPELMNFLLDATEQALNAGFEIPVKDLEERWMINELEPGDRLFKLAEGVKLDKRQSEK